MKTISISSFRKNQSSVTKELESGEPMLLTIKGHKNIVLIAQEDYEEMMETLYLLSNPGKYAKIINPEPCSDGPFHSATEMIDFLLNEKD